MQLNANDVFFICVKHIWCLGPCLRAHKINCAFIRNCCTVGLAAACGPIVETCGLLLGKIKVRYQKLPEGEDRDMFTV